MAFARGGDVEVATACRSDAELPPRVGDGGDYLAAPFPAPDQAMRLRATERRYSGNSACT